MAPVEDRDRIGDPQGHRIGRGIMRLVAAAVAAMIREYDAEAFARDGIDQRPLAQVLDNVAEAVVEDDRGAIAALVLEVDAASVLTVRRVRHRFADLLQARIFAQPRLIYCAAAAHLTAM